MDIETAIKTYPLRLMRKDYKKMKEDSSDLGLSCSAYLRKLIKKQEIKPKPPDSYKDLVWKISKIGIDIKQIIDKAKTVESISQKDVETTVFLLSKIIELMREKG